MTTLTSATRKLSNIETIGFMATDKFNQLGKTYFFKELVTPFEDIPDYVESGNRFETEAKDKESVIQFMMFELPKNKAWSLWVEYENGEQVPYIDRV